MATPEYNPGFHMLAEFACDAILPPGSPEARPTSLGRNAGITVIAEFIDNVGPQSGDNEPDRREPPES